MDLTFIDICAENSVALETRLTGAAHARSSAVGEIGAYGIGVTATMVDRTRRVGS